MSNMCRTPLPGLFMQEIMVKGHLSPWIEPPSPASRLLSRNCNRSVHAASWDVKKELERKEGSENVGQNDEDSGSNGKIRLGGKMPCVWNAD